MNFHFSFLVKVKDQLLSLARNTNSAVVKATGAIYKMSSKGVLQKKLEQSLVALREYFSPSKKQEGIGNVAQLVLFAEHAAKVSLIFLLEPTITNPCNARRMAVTQLHGRAWSSTTVWTLPLTNSSSEHISARPCSLEKWKMSVRVLLK